MIQYKINITLFTKEKYFILLLQFDEYTETENEKIQEFLEKTQRHIETDCTLSFGISNQVQSPVHIPVCYHEAVEAIHSGCDLKMEGFIRFYKVREINELLIMIPKTNVRDHCDNTLNNVQFPIP